MNWRPIGDAPTDESNVVLLCALHNGQYVEVLCRRENGVFKSVIVGRDEQYDPVIKLAVAWSRGTGDEQDAKRYRWLRQGNAYYPEENYLRGWKELDDGIDAEMAREQGGSA